MRNAVRKIVKKTMFKLHIQDSNKTFTPTAGFFMLCQSRTVVLRYLELQGAKIQTTSHHLNGKPRTIAVNKTVPTNLW